MTGFNIFKTNQILVGQNTDTNGLLIEGVEKGPCYAQNAVELMFDL